MISGMLGEQRAEEFLKGQGYKILNRNFRYGRHEIDIIARKGGILVFIEVKLRSSLKFGYPEEFVRPTQISSIRLAASRYLEETKWTNDIRFDIIGISASLGELTHFEDAF